MLFDMPTKVKNLMPSNYPMVLIVDEDIDINPGNHIQIEHLFAENSRSPIEKIYLDSAMLQVIQSLSETML